MTKIPKFDPSKKPSLKGKSVKDYKREVAVLYAELQRRDKRIAELEEDNRILMRTAVRAQAKAKEMEHLLEEFKKQS